MTLDVNASTQPPPPQLPPEAMATLPNWVKAAILLVPMGTGAASGLLSGGTAAAQERAILAEKVERLQEDVEKLDGKIDALLERVLESR